MGKFNNKIAIIGLGSIGVKHLILLRKLRPEIDITLVRSGNGRSIDEEKIANRKVNSLDEAIDIGIEAAIISTPASLHLEQAIKLAGSNIHLFIEKPLSISTKKIDYFSSLVDSNKLIVLLGYVFRHNLGAKKFENILKSEDIGEIIHVKIDSGSYLPSWRQGINYKNSVSAKKTLGGGVLLELSHELDYINWFFPYLVSLSGFVNYSGSLEIDVEDSADVYFKTQKNFQISMHIDFNTRFPRRHCIARCSNGDLVWNAIENNVTWRPVDGKQEIIQFENEQINMYERQLRHFFKCIEGDSKPAVSIKEGYNVLNLIELISKSNSMQKAVLI